MDQALVSAVNFATTIALVRWIGLRSFGVFSLIWMAVLFAIGVQQACISQPLLTISGKHAKSERQTYYGAVLWLQLAFTALLFVVSWASCLAVSTIVRKEELVAVALPVAVLIAAKQAHGFVRSVYFAREKRAGVLTNDAIAYLGQIALLFYVWKSGRLDLGTTLWSIALPSLLAVGIGVAGYGTFRTTKADLKRVATRHWIFSRWLVAKAVLQWFSSNYFLIAAGAVLGTTALGAVKAAQTMLGVLHVFFLAMENIVPVQAARIHLEKGTSALANYMERLAWSGTVLTLAISMIVMAWPEMLLRLVYGHSSADLVLALRALAVLYVFVFEVAVLQLLFRTLEHTRPIFVSFAVTALISLVVAYPVVNAFGLTGVVGGMIGQQVLMTIFLFIGLTRLLERASHEDEIAA